ncbi:NADH:flavin oxidoreductase [Acidisoma sp. S159]|uniref:NADH:flavin oxidoreductase n=1 Tax=Acidisoma sp. S159 TaxID=1747225 RepID=UPI00131C9562|nr:NADH:flavin oxidoreductase [Acidisoma sp. S159]
MGDYDALLKPIRIGPLQLRNRIFSTGHAPGLANDGMPGERYQRYHEEKAKGGLALTIFGGSSAVAVDSPLSFSQIDCSSDRILPYLEGFSRRIHAHGAALFCQLTHLGRRGAPEGRDGLPLIAPSYNREQLHRSYAKEMEDWDFTRVIKAFADAADRCKRGGLDGIEVIAAAHHLIDSFLSPVTNTRTDRYGGSLENRMRFGMEVMTAIRERVGSDFVVGMRIAGDDFQDGGIDQAEGLRIMAGFANSGLIDCISVYQAHGDTGAGLVGMMPDMSFPTAPFLHLPSALKSETDLPVLHASAIRDIATAARALAEGHVDMVAMTRAHIADPHIVNKIMAGKADQIRQCVGANYCVDHAGQGGIGCIQNAATAKEQSLPHIVPLAAERRRVVVAGGGPGGLEAARVAAARGHEVVLFEASAKLGGQLNLARSIAWRESLLGIIRWLEQQVRQGGVEIRLNERATAEAVQAARPDVVVVATGGRPNPPVATGADLAVSAWDVMSGTTEPGHTVLVYDEIGQQSGATVAEYLALRGSEVELATPDRLVGEAIGHTAYVAHVRNLYKNKVLQTPDVRLTQLYREGNGLVAVLRNEYTGSEEERMVDQVVYETGTRPNDDLYYALRPFSSNRGAVDYDALLSGRTQNLRSQPEGTFQLFRIGDAIMSRNVHSALYDALRLVKDV